MDSTTATVNGYPAASVTKNPTGTLTVTFAFPAIPAVTIDYAAETLSTTAAMEYGTNGGTSWTACTADMAATAFGWNGSAAVTVQFRTVATGTQDASNAQTVTIPARPATPALRIDNASERVPISGE